MSATTWEPEAGRLREEGKSFREIAKLVGRSPSQVFRVLNPEAGELSRKYSRDWKRRNPERAREQQRRAQETSCPRCGGRMSIRSKKCLSCRERAVHLRSQQIERLWAEGWKLSEIADYFGWTVGHISLEVDRLRKRGYQLPHRYRRRFR